MHQNLDNAFSDLMMQHDTISLHSILRTPPVESNVLATTISFFTLPGSVYPCLCQQCLISHYPQNGVLQGSILSVTLFKAAINEMLNTVGPPVKVPACVTNITSYYASSSSPVEIE
jgi:hypothetical protein